MPKHVEDRPTHPVYADQKWHGIPLSLRAKVLATLVVLAVVGVMLYLAALVDNIQTNRAKRDRDTAQLACLLVQDTPPGNDLGDALREKYHCPAYSNRSNRLTPTSTTTVTRSASPKRSIGALPGDATAPSASLPGAPGVVDTSSRAHTRNAPGERSAPPGRTHAQPRPSPTPSGSSKTPKPPTSSKPRPKPTPTPTPSGLCKLPIVGGLCGLLGA